MRQIYTIKNLYIWPKFNNKIAPAVATPIKVANLLAYKPKGFDYYRKGI